jgi:hypothetical protein
MRPGVQLQGKNILWDAYRSSTKAGADAHALRCSLFGQNHDDKPQGNDTLVLLNNIRRAVDGLTEPVAAPKAWEAVAPGCNQCGCCQIESRKTIYNISRVRRCGPVQYMAGVAALRTTKAHAAAVAVTDLDQMT